jgi:UDP-glucose 4-epimerase
VARGEVHGRCRSGRRLTKIVVTGGSGRIGRYLLRELAPDHVLVNADRVRGEDAADWVETDVMDLDAVRRVTKGADAVIHLAALDFDWPAEPEDFIRVNTLGSWHVLQAAAENGVPKVVLTSSISACGLQEMRPDWKPRYLPIDEAHECRPVHPYSVSKLVIERIGLSFVHGTSMNVVCLRPLAVVAPETLAEYVRFVENPELHWLFYYVTADDVARAYRAALDSSLRYGVFFLSADDSSRAEPTLEWYAQQMDGLPELANPRRYERDPRASVFSNEHARELLGWEATSNFLELKESLT